MSTNFTHTYVAELERLILDELLPIYKRWHQEQGLDISYQNVHPDLMQQIKRAKTLPKLMQPW
jgi:hypothetical protein